MHRSTERGNKTEQSRLIYRFVLFRESHFKGASVGNQAIINLNLKLEELEMIVSHLRSLRWTHSSERLHPSPLFSGVSCLVSSFQRRRFLLEGNLFAV